MLRDLDRHPADQLAHSTNIFGLGVTSNYTITGSGSSSFKLHSTSEPEHPLLHTFKDAHKLGCHHVAASKSANLAVTVGFEGHVKLWDLEALELKYELRG